MMDVRPPGAVVVHVEAHDAQSAFSTVKRRAEPGQAGLLAQQVTGAWCRTGGEHVCHYMVAAR